MRHRTDRALELTFAAILLALGVGILGRGYWTPDEPREADIAWRMSWQTDRAVPLLAGEAFCEKPPLAYWIAGASIRAFGADAWAARLPNLLYALVTACAVGLLGRRSAGAVAGVAAAAAVATFLLTYQVAIWLATDAPLLATVAVALLGLYSGFYANRTGERLRGYTGMHAALALGFLSKSAAAWMVPALGLGMLVIWERRWRELLRWELYVGLGLQAVIILTWVAFVYTGADGLAHLRVFFWNNLAGRFAHVDAPEELQYAGAHRNSPGKYLLELPVYLWPWTLLVMAAARRAWRQRHAPPDELRPVRFAVAVFVPTLGVLSIAATARNIYLAPALPGLALLLGWWARESFKTCDRWDRRALRGTAALLLIAVAAIAGAVLIVGRDSWTALPNHVSFSAVSVMGLLAGVMLASVAWRAAGRGLVRRGLLALLLAYCALLVGPASQLYGRVDGWQDLGSIGRAIGHDSAGRPLILFAPDETTRAFIDLYARTSVEWIAGPISPVSIQALRLQLARTPQSVVVVQLPGSRNSNAVRELAQRFGLRPRSQGGNSSAAEPVWPATVGLRIDHVYSLPNGRRYALLAPREAATSPDSG